MATRMALMKQLMKPRKKFKPQLAEAAKKTRWDIVRGDTVQVIGYHPESGKQGKVIKVIRKADRVLVEGVNVKPRRFKGDPDRGIKGRVEMMERSIHYSKVNLVDPVTGLPTRVSRKYLDDGTKVRVSKKSGAVIPKPPKTILRKNPISSTVTESCTEEEYVWETTYFPDQPRTENGDVNVTEGSL